LRIEAYFARLRDLIETCPVVQLSNVTYEKRGTHAGFVRGELSFVDGSILHLREYVDVENVVDCLMYVYQYAEANQALIFRYDNTGHHRRMNLASYPHHKHKHEGSEMNIIPSSAPDLAEVLEEIQRLIVLP
jgi:hypothetical protein